LGEPRQKEWENGGTYQRGCTYAGALSAADEPTAEDLFRSLECKLQHPDTPTDKREQCQNLVSFADSNQ
jgi:hypothetical protein